MKPSDRDAVEAVIKAGEDYLMVLASTLFPKPGETPPFDETRRIFRRRLLDAVDELISYAELRK